MNILLIHNRYKERGGEDGVVEREADLLRADGHRVRVMEKDNRDIQSRARAVSTALGTPWNFSSTRRLARVLRADRPDVAHIHNLFPQWSPGCVHTLNRLGVPTVMTVHNYRILCPSATLHHRGGIYTESLDKRLPLRPILDRVYRGSLAGTATQILSNALHRSLGTYTRKLGGFIFLTPFQRDLFLRHVPGLDPDRCHLKPNFLPDPGPPDPSTPRDGWVFIGRLAEEKGVPFLLDLFKREPPGTLDIYGTGPLEDEARDAARAHPAIRHHGRVDPERVFQALSRADGLLFPSQWYEGFPLTLVEAMAHGTPVIASNLGSMASILEDGVHGRLPPPGDANAWRDALRHARPDTLRQWGRNARTAYLDHYTPEHNLEQLLEIYHAIRSRHG